MKTLVHYQSQTLRIFRWISFRASKKNTIKIPFYDIQSYKEIISKLKKEKIIALIVEPIQGQIIEPANEKYLKEICEISKK